MIKIINFISFFIFSALLALTPVHAASHSNAEKAADATSEKTTEATAAENTDKKKEKKAGGAEEEPDCE